MQIDIPKIDLKRVVIIGGGFAGLELAKALDKSKFQVVLVDKNNYHVFQPLLYQVATSAIGSESIAFPIRDIFKGVQNFYFRLAEVNSIDPEHKTIFTNIGDLEYDYLVVATGAITNYFNMEGLILRSMPMKSIPEALDLRSLILQNFEQALGITNQRKKQAYMNFVIAGAGPTGVELAGALGEMKKHVLPKDYPELDFGKMNIYLIQSGDRVLPAFSKISSEKTKKYLELLEVEVVLHTRVTDYFGDFVQTDTGREIFARTLIWTTGVRGVTVNGISKDVISKSNRIKVNEFNEVLNHQNIFAIGDCAAMESTEFPMGHPQVAPAGMQQGLHLAKNLNQLMTGKAFVPFKYTDKGMMATVGKNKAVVEVGKMKLGGAFAWYIWMFVHLFSLAGFNNRVFVFINWVRNYFSSERGLRIILEQFDRKAAKNERKKEMEKDL